MIITNKFVFIHVPKTGGTFVREHLKLLNCKWPELQLLEITKFKHSGISKIPEEYKHLPIVSCLRDPISHMISRFNFKWWLRNSENRFDLKKVKLTYPNFPNLNIEEFYELMCNYNLRNDKQIRKSHLLALKKSIGFCSLTYFSKFCKRLIKTLKEDDEKIIFEKIKFAFSNISFLNTNNLSNDLFLFLKNYNDIPYEYISEIKQSKKIIPKADPRNSKNDNPSHFESGDINEKKIDISDSLSNTIKYKERFLYQISNFNA